MSVINNISSRWPKIIGNSFKQSAPSSANPHPTNNLNDSNGVVFDISDEAQKHIGLFGGNNNSDILPSHGEVEPEAQFTDYYI